MRQNVYSLAVFTGVDLFALNFAWRGLPPSTILGIRKLETLGYPMAKTASLCVPSFWHNTGVWWTDGRTDGFAVAYTALAKLTLRRAVKTRNDVNCRRIRESSSVVYCKSLASYVGRVCLSSWRSGTWKRPDEILCVLKHWAIEGRPALQNYGPTTVVY